jgi:hypothetical protein
VVRDAKTGVTLRTYEPSNAGTVRPLTAASFSQDGTMVVTVTDQGVVTAYETVTGRVILQPGFGETGSTARAATASWGVACQREGTT